MKRLFITTGLISLINALTVIENTEEDTLIILSFSQDEDFCETSLKIASLHKFKKVLFFKKEREIMNNIHLCDYDEVYSTVMSKLFCFLNKHPAWYIFDEGAGYAIADLKNFKNLKRCYVTKFLDKFDLVNIPPDIEYLYINKAKFLEISDKVISILGEQAELPTRRNVLFIGHYIYKKLGNDSALKYYKQYIDYFMNLGYHVYFKAHPRDKDTLLPHLVSYYKNNEKFCLLKSSLPVEIYNYNFDIVIGSYSGTLVSLPYYRNIPAVNLPMKEIYSTNVGLNYKKFFALYEEYIPDFETMKECLAYTKNEIWGNYQKFIDSKPNIEKNTKLRKILDYKPDKRQDILFTIISYCFIFNKKIMKKVQNYARKDFYKMLQL